MSGNKVGAQFETDHEVCSGSVPTIPPAAERDPEFYFDDSLVVIQVESALFRVHKFQLTKSETFSDMFMMPNGVTSGTEEGASPENPIVLSGVKASEFKALLKVLYADYFPEKKPKCEPEIIVPAFRLAHMWNFSDLRTRLLPLVNDSLGCVDKITLGTELGIQEWLVPAYVELCQRTDPLTVDEGLKLGVHNIITITRLREQFRPSQSVSAWNYCDNCGGTSPIFTNHGAANCHQCGTHINSSHFRFPVIPSGTAPDPGRLQIYCHNCGINPPTRSEHGEADCHRCGIHIRSNTKYYRYTTSSSSTAPPSSNAGLESQVKKWVEAGCATE